MQFIWIRKCLQLGIVSWMATACQIICIILYFESEVDITWFLRVRYSFGISILHSYNSFIIHSHFLIKTFAKEVRWSWSAFFRLFHLQTRWSGSATTCVSSDPPTMTSLFAKAFVRWRLPKPFLRIPVAIHVLRRTRENHQCPLQWLSRSMVVSYMSPSFHRLLNRGRKTGLKADTDTDNDANECRQADSHACRQANR